MRVETDDHTIQFTVSIHDIQTSCPRIIHCLTHSFSLSQEVSVESQSTAKPAATPPAETEARSARAVCAHLAVDMDALVSLNYCLL